MAKKFDQDMIDNAIKLYYDGISIADVSRQTGISRTSLKRYFKDNNVCLLNKKKVVDTNTKEEVVTMYTEGKTFMDIARTLNINVKTAKNIVVDRGIYVNKNLKAKTDRDNLITELVNEGLTAGAIGKKLKMHPDTIRVHAKRLGLEIKRVPKITKEITREIEIMGLAGYTVSEIADQLGIKEVSVEKRLVTSRDKTMDIDYSKLVDLYATGMPAKHIARNYGVSYYTLLRKIRDEGIPIRHTGNPNKIDIDSKKLAKIVEE